LIEWFGRLLRDEGAVAVLSRPEPAFLRPRYNPQRVAANTVPIDRVSYRLPNPMNRRDWWARSASSYPSPSSLGDSPLITWNPFFAARLDDARVGKPKSTTFDLLDDWSVHFAFASIRREVEAAYHRAFDVADSVFANSEGTLALAHRFGRSDARLLLNGTDPDRFTTRSSATGPIAVGYVGKIGKRLDLDLILTTARALPRVSFVFAGPILDRDYRAPLASLENVKLLGDVHYDDVPKLLSTFDIGWIPHRVGDGEVGGDVIKTYEYRAAGLPVLSTPIGGIQERGFSNVAVLSAVHHARWISDEISGKSRLTRRPEAMPPEMTWRRKASTILDDLGIPHAR
jgi:glycosyltransferase involved in cell wall biosynthesis